MGSISLKFTVVELERLSDPMRTMLRRLERGEGIRRADVSYHEARTIAALERRGLVFGIPSVGKMPAEISLTKRARDLLAKERRLQKEGSRIMGAMRRNYLRDREGQS